MGQNANGNLLGHSSACMIWCSVGRAVRGWSCSLNSLPPDYAIGPGKKPNLLNKEIEALYRVVWFKEHTYVHVARNFRMVFLAVLHFTLLAVDI